MKIDKELKNMESHVNDYMQRKYAIGKKFRMQLQSNWKINIYEVVSLPSSGTIRVKNVKTNKIVSFQPQVHPHEPLEESPVTMKTKPPHQAIECMNQPLAWQYQARCIEIVSPAIVAYGPTKEEALNNLWGYIKELIPKLEDDRNRKET